jgi:hypothetical protein
MKSKSVFLKVGGTLIGKEAISYLITNISYNNKDEAILYELSNCKPQHLNPLEPHSISIVRSRPILCSLEEVLKAFDNFYRFSSILGGAQDALAARRLFLIEKSNLVNCGKSSII